MCCVKGKNLLFVEHCLEVLILDEEDDVQECRHSNDQDDDE